MGKIIKFVQWDINSNCNYNCSYCVSKKRLISQKDIILPTVILRQFKKYLTGSWRVYFCGPGEPFLTPGFLDVVRELIKMGHQVGVHTNFSAPLDEIYEFAKITKGKLFYFGASLHLEQTDLKHFFKKALAVKILVGCHFYVSSVARKGYLIKLEEISKLFKDKNIKFKMQLERRIYGKIRPNKELFFADLFVNYSKKELDIIKKNNNYIFSKENLNFNGKLCWAGAKYLTIDEYANVWRCLPAMRIESECLGNIMDETFELKKKPYPCQCDCCYCLTPIFYKYNEVYVK